MRDPGKYWHVLNPVNVGSVDDSMNSNTGGNKARWRLNQHAEVVMLGYLRSNLLPGQMGLIEAGEILD